MTTERNDDPPTPDPTTGNTTPSQFRLTEEDKRRIDFIRDHFGFWSRTDVLRLAVDELFNKVKDLEPEKEKRGKYLRGSWLCSY